MTNTLQERIDAKPGAKITLAEMEARIVVKQYIGTEELAPAFASTLTLCVLKFDNGFTLVGKSGCADPANFDRKIGEELAYKDAIGQAWPLFGFNLAETIFRYKLPENGELVSGDGVATSDTDDIPGKAD